MDGAEIDEDDPALTSSSHGYTDKDGNARKITVMILWFACRQPILSQFKQATYDIAQQTSNPVVTITINQNF